MDAGMLWAEGDRPWADGDRSKEDSFSDRSSYGDPGFIKSSSSSIGECGLSSECFEGSVPFEMWCLKKKQIRLIVCFTRAGRRLRKCKPAQHLVMS